ncbi:Imm42 family immunity protein [Pseudodesulfovibrio sediminis]|uniref:Uncharacterized protein n=1 Tax=Pseudodesulfovibrio sediminis TaxID=2810563 RepID=A0ABM7P751_9BACT|nr:Imm42 family immunity protein [Pseudodesulfovibrio sediminis]BCS88790.1 hypothetical protein PSDVSF_20320 [Pseudodesulfovibrio sediminis]
MIIGNKQKFALDIRLFFKDDNSIYFQSSLWIGGRQISGGNDEVVLFQLICDLEAAISFNGKRSFDTLDELDADYFYPNFLDAVFMEDSNHKYYSISQEEKWINAHIDVPPITNFGFMWLIDGYQKSTVITHDDKIGTCRDFLPKGYIDNVLVELKKNVNIWLKNNEVPPISVSVGSSELIGDKKRFATEIALGMPYEGRLAGKFCYWVNGVKFGDFTFTWVNEIKEELLQIIKNTNSRAKNALFSYNAHDLYYNFSHTVFMGDKFHPCWEKSLEELWEKSDITPNIIPQFDGVTVVSVDNENKSKVVAYDFDKSLVECIIERGQVDKILTDTILVIENWEKSTRGTKKKN